MKVHGRALFIFRRDLRLADNTALIAALKASELVIPCFIFDPRQTGPQPYRSLPAINFMAGSLMDLEEQLKAQNALLYIFQGVAHEVVEGLIKSEKIDAVYVNEDYTPFSRKRDAELLKACQKNGISFFSFHDALLNAPGTVKKDDGSPYVIFTPYWRKARSFEVPEPVVNKFKNYYRLPIRSQNRELFRSLSASIKINDGCLLGRRAALKILKDLSLFKHYDRERDFPSLRAGTGLSAHHKFGTCSIRETYYAVRKQLGFDHTLLRELYWRDFFTQIGYYFPKVLGQSFHARYDRIVWEEGKERFQRWCDGRTGFPIVDAGMRELNQTGSMHNRVRMITASFLVKDLHIDWRCGEKYFAQKLVDYDPLVNNGNWQWAASTGCDAQPYFRIFNPWAQQKKFDPQARYIKEWVPELRPLSAEDIHQWQNRQRAEAVHYPLPMLDHKLETDRALAMYKRISN